MAGALKTTTSRKRRGGIGWMILATLVCVAATPFGAVGALFSPLVFDERGNLLNPLAWLSFFLMISFWIVCLLAPATAWVLWRRDREQWAWTAMAAPLIWAIALMTLLQFVPG